MVDNRVVAMVDCMVGHRDMTDHRDSVGHMVLLAAGLGGQSQGDLLTAGLSNDDFLLINSVGGISKLGNVEALVLDLVLALDLSDLDGLGDTDLLGSRIGKLASDLQRGGDERDLVCLGLVFLATHLMFSLAISMVSIAISSSSTSSDLHGLRLLLIGHLSGGASSDHIFPLVLVGAQLSVHEGGGLLTNGEYAIKAVVIVHHFLDCKSDWGHLLSKGRDTHLGIN